jgi:sulfonate transport system ATP-binding protein
MHQLILSLWRQHRPSVLLVTHDVDEAVLLADRVLVLEKGRIAADIAITQQRPRSADAPQFQKVRAQLLQLLGVEIESPAEAQPQPQIPTPIVAPFNFSNFSI